MTLLQIGENNDVLLYVGLCLVGSFICYFLLLRSVRANHIVRNQEVIIYLMKKQFVNQGATEVEIKQMDEDIVKLLDGQSVNQQYTPATNPVTVP